jgi:hypothetical protein
MESTVLNADPHVEIWRYEMDSWKVVLIDQTGGVPVAALQQYANALQQQTDNDLAPAWNVRADISVLPGGENIPPGTWPINIVDSLNGGGGVHRDDQGQVYANVTNDDNLSLTISHELLEMLVDPSGDRLMSAPDLDPGFPGRQVSYLVEVCDPCEIYSYVINNVTVSDFILPSFYDPTATGQVDVLGALAGPLPQNVPSGCYISWFDPQDQMWHEQQANGAFVIGAGTSSRNPRDDRDSVFGSADSERHNIPAIYQAWSKAVECLPKPG